MGELQSNHCGQFSNFDRTSPRDPMDDEDPSCAFSSDEERPYQWRYDGRREKEGETYSDFGLISNSDEDPIFDTDDQVFEYEKQQRRLQRKRRRDKARQK